MTESTDSEAPWPFAHLFSDAEHDELSELMLSFDGGMLDYGELDGFLSALAVAPQPQTLDRWWAALLGPEPAWEAEHEPQRARELIERYYVMLQARIAMSPFDLGPDSMPPLFSMTDDDPDFEPKADVDFDDIDDIDEQSFEDYELQANNLSTAANLAGEATLVDPELADFDDDDDEEDDDQYEFDVAMDDDDLDDDDLDDDESEFADEDFDYNFAVGETWLSGFRYALSLQADDWRRVIEAEPGLSRWLYALWQAADKVQGDAGSSDVLPAMAPNAAAPEDAGFLSLESALRESSAQQESLSADESALLNLLPVVLHQLWRRHRDGVESVAAALEHDANLALVGHQQAIRDELSELLQLHTVPSGGMTLEQLDGYWSAQIAAGVEVGPLDSLVRICGEDKVWESAEDARAVMVALMGYWNEIRDRLQRKLNPDDERCHPHIDLPEDFDPAHPPKEAYGREFARSFLAAVEDFPRSAKLLLMDPEARHWMAPIQALADGHSLANKGARMNFDERMVMIAELPECMAELSSFWNAAGGARTQTPTRAEATPGRNDPCPCGSGKKYKKCHGAPERLN